MTQSTASVETRYVPRAAVRARALLLRTSGILILGGVGIWLVSALSLIHI